MKQTCHTAKPIPHDPKEGHDTTVSRTASQFPEPAPLTKWAHVFRRIYEGTVFLSGLVGLVFLVGTPVYALVRVVRGDLEAWGGFVFLYAFAAMAVTSACLMYCVSPLLMLLVYLVLWVYDGGVCYCCESVYHKLLRCNVEWPLTPPPEESREVSMFLTACAIFWNAITWTMAGTLIKDMLETGEVVWFLVFFMCPFVVLGFVLLAVAIWNGALYFLFFYACCCWLCKKSGVSKLGPAIDREDQDELELMSNATLSTAPDSTLELV